MSETKQGDVSEVAVLREQYTALKAVNLDLQRKLHAAHVLCSPRAAAPDAESVIGCAACQQIEDELANSVASAREAAAMLEIEELRARVDELESQLAEATETIAALSGRQDDAHGDVATDSEHKGERDLSSERQPHGAALSAISQRTTALAKHRQHSAPLEQKRRRSAENDWHNRMQRLERVCGAVLTVVLAVTVAAVALFASLFLWTSRWHGLYR